MHPALWPVVFIGGLLFLVFLWLLVPLFPTWIRSLTSGAKIGPLKLVLMRLMKINPHVVVQARIMAVQAGLSDVETRSLEAHYLAGEIEKRGARRHFLSQGIHLHHG